MQQTRTTTCFEAEFEVCGKRGKGRIHNISDGGVFVGTRAIPEEGENVDVSFETPDGEMVTLSGMVWWTTSDSDPFRNPRSGFGLRLLEDSAEFRQLLQSI